jgi:hypothetical protein
MRPLLLTLFLLLPSTLSAAKPPLVEKYLHAGQFVIGEQVVERELIANPKNDQLRFSLAVVRLALGIERLGQSWYEYGATPNGFELFSFRVPIPENANPNTITYQKFRTLLDDTRRGLQIVERTLADITDDNVKLPLRLAKIKLDLDGDGNATDEFAKVLERLMGRRPQHLEANPEFLVCFDRGDVAWLRSYCHILMGLIDFTLAFDAHAPFEEWGHRTFPKIRPTLGGTDEEKQRRLAEANQKTPIVEPKRLARFREHILEVAKLNRETWKYIRAETDDDHEWLPNPKQKGVLGLPVQDRMIDAWLGLMGHLEDMFEGRKLIPVGYLTRKHDKGLNLKTALLDPPGEVDFNRILKEGFREKYLEVGKQLTIQELVGFVDVFQGQSLGMYMLYFN